MEMPRLTKTYRRELVVALSMPRFIEYCKRHNRNPRDYNQAVYVQNAEALMGIDRQEDTRIVLTQDWVLRADWYAIWTRLHYLKACGVVIGEDHLPEIVTYRPDKKTGGRVATPDNWDAKITLAGTPPVPGVSELRRHEELKRLQKRKNRGLIR